MRGAYGAWRMGVAGRMWTVPGMDVTVSCAADEWMPVPDRLSLLVRVLAILRMRVDSVVLVPVLMTVRINGSALDPSFALIA